VIFARGTQRTLLITGAVLFGAFGIVAFVFRRLDVSQQTLSIVGGVFAYAFLVVAVIVILRWRRRGRDASRAATRYVVRHPAVASAVGEPVRVGRPQGEMPAHGGASQANLVVAISGPEGEGWADLVMARLQRDWEVLSATLVVDGDRVRLAEGPADGAGDD
jgi:hypothetical protein